SPLLGVNTPRSDENRLKLMELMVFLLQKVVCDDIGITAARLSSYCCRANSDVVEGFEQIIDFLSGSYIHYALTLQLQALVDKKKIVISEAVIREILLLNDVEGMKFLIHTILQSLSAKRTSWNEFSIAVASAVICLSKGQRFNFSKYIFDSLVRNVDSSSKFYMVKKGFSGVKTPLFEEDVVEDVAEDVAHVATPSPSPYGIPSLPQEPSSPPQQPHVTPPRLEIVKLKARVKNLEKIDKVKSSKFRRLRKVGESRQVESSDDMEDVFNQGRIINEDEGIELVKDAEIAESEGRQADKQAQIYNIDLDHSSKVLSMQEDDSEVQEVVEIVTMAKLITKVVTAAASQVSAASTTIPAASVTICVAAPTVVAAYTRRRNGVIIRDPKEELSLKTSAKTPAETPKVKDKGKGIMVKAPKPMKKKDQIELDAEYARKLHEEINKDVVDFNNDIDWDATMDHVNQKSSINPQYIKRYQGMKKRPQTESEALKNIMIYLKNTVGYKMDFFKEMSYADICPIFQARLDENMRFLFKSKEEIEEEDKEIIRSINETPAQKAAKRRKLSEEAQEAKDLRKRLDVVEDKDNDVFVKATPLASKVPVVDYQIVVIDNKPRFKIIKADETHQLYISFATLLKNFDREDLETL
nr:synaptobrevin, longin-like domain protein [Tanacetum cinerariifolium]